MTIKSDITLLLQDLGEGKEVFDQLYPLIYSELHEMACMRMSMERSGHTYSKTELVHEVYLKMFDQTKLSYNNRSHFLAVASNCMRQILVDHARKKKAQKRNNGQDEMTYIDGLFSKYEESSQELLNINEALDKLASLNKRLSDVVVMRFFGEMKIEEIAEVLEISESTVNRDWMKARGWLHKELK